MERRNQDEESTQGVQIKRVGSLQRFCSDRILGTPRAGEPLNDLGGKDRKSCHQRETAGRAGRGEELGCFASGVVATKQGDHLSWFAAERVSGM